MKDTQAAAVQAGAMLDELERLAREAEMMPWENDPTDVPWSARKALADACTADRILRLVAVARVAESAAALLERCGPHLQGVERECCGHYESDYGGEYMGQREVVPVCCGQAMDLSDRVANELRVLGEAIAALKEST